QALQAGAVRIGFEDVHVGVKIPLIAAPLPGALVLFSPVILLGVMFPGVGIEMAAGEDDFLAIRREVSTRCPPGAGTDAAASAGAQLHDKDLIKWIPRVSFLCLEDDLLAVRGKVAFAGADKIEGDLPDVLEVSGFELLPIGVIGPEDE